MSELKKCPLNSGLCMDVPCPCAWYIEKAGKCAITLLAEESLERQENLSKLKNIVTFGNTGLESEGNNIPEGYWWCPCCKEELSASRVTYHELCDTCGTAVAWVDGVESYEELKERADAAERRAEVAEKALEFAIGNCAEFEPIVTELANDDGEEWNDFCKKCNGELDSTVYWMEFYKKKAGQALKEKSTDV